MITPIRCIPTLPDPSEVGQRGLGAEAGSFSGILNDVMDRLETTRQDANQKIQALLSGDSQDIHQVALATQKAELTFELTQQVRNKMVTAYQELMRTQL